MVEVDFSCDISVWNRWFGKSQAKAGDHMEGSQSKYSAVFERKHLESAIITNNILYCKMWS